MILYGMRHPVGLRRALLAESAIIYRCAFSLSSSRVWKRARAAGNRQNVEVRMNHGNYPAAQANAPSRRQAIVSVAVALAGFALGSGRARAGTEEELSHTAESIHQEAPFKASRKRVYEALTDSKQFNQVTQLSAAMRSGALGKTPTEIGREVGDAFTLFGGYIVGRH